MSTPRQKDTSLDYAVEEVCGGHREGPRGLGGAIGPTPAWEGADGHRPKTGHPLRHEASRLFHRPAMG